MGTINKRIIVILGMHRSGTSVITRALAVMGVELGKRFIPTMEGVNSKGFWEDIDLNAFDEELLGVLETTWYDLAPINADDVKVLRDKGYHLRAVELIREKTRGVPIFGFKDPRVTKLLPFWKEVFCNGNFKVNYVIAVRHPLSVVRSLSKRDGFEAEQSYLLWLGHTISSLTESGGGRRVLVDYDRFMQSPDHELSRIAQVIGLEISQIELESFKKEFLDPVLRHTIFDLNDLSLDVTCPPIVREVYSDLLDVASGRGNLDSLEIQNKVASWACEFAHSQFALKLADIFLAQKRSLAFSLNDSEIKIASLNQGIVERDSQIASLNQGIVERDSQIASLNQGIGEHAVLYEKIIGSKSWLVTKPFRWLGRVLRGEFEAALDPFKNTQKPNDKVAIEQQDGTQSNAFQFEVLRGEFPIQPTHYVAVIIPVYRDVEMTRRCILAAMPSVLSDPNAKLLAINDASPNEGMQEMLEQLALKWPNRFLALKNEKNLGFVRTVNRGLAHFHEYDVVLLNSDVVVPQDWLSRLVDEAYSIANAGTVTPFSNNATICSFPYFLQENAQPFDLDVNVIDAVFRQEKLPCIQAPTGVGFCMYIRRACLDQIGYLNEEKFGRGYGEENDLCQRALKSGWLNLISPNMYAFHEGGVSFSSDKQALVDRAMHVLGELHPNYHADVQRFIEADPIKSARVIRYARLLATIPVPKILHVSHSVGGGVKQHVDELAEYYGQRMAHILLTPKSNGGLVQISLGVTPSADSTTFKMPMEYVGMLGLLRALGISAVHFHHTHGFDQRILRIAEDLGVVRIITVHDYYWLCANPTLTDEEGIYPGYYSAQLLNPLYRLPDGVTEAKWQEPLRSFIEGADCVIFPAHATKRIFESVYRPAKSVVAPHIESQLDINAPVRPFIKKSRYTIGVLGAIGREKGADFLEEIAEKARKAGLNFNFKIIGYAYRPLKQVEASGPYDAKKLSHLIIENDLDLLFFTARWPETYSYTLSYALNSGLPIVAPGVGAFPERLVGRANTLLFNHLDTPEALITQLKVFVDTLVRGEAAIAPALEQIVYQQNFYDCDYPEAVARTLKIVETHSHEWMEQIKVGMCGSVPESGKAPWQEALAHLLWRLRMNPNLRWISNAVPHGIRRKIRLSLSSRNSDDLARGSKGG